MRMLYFAVALALLAGCPGPRGQTTPSKTSTTTGNPQTNPENSTAMNPVMPPQTKMPSRQSPPPAAPAINVQLTEYTIEMPDTLTAGTHSFTITNAGTMKHNFAIEGPGVTEKLASDLMRGDSAPMTVNLQKGTYTVYCPVDGHRGRGMSRTITVQ
ncbi:MAG TPA: plastocyanin/azurin family copper-binding protein [Thermoanaerobaculia bacterium]